MPFNLIFLLVVKEPISVMLDAVLQKEMNCDFEVGLT